MDQMDSQIVENLQETAPTKKKRKTWVIIVSIILAIVLIAVAGFLYVKLYKILK